MSEAGKKHGVLLISLVKLIMVPGTWNLVILALTWCWFLTFRKYYHACHKPFSYFHRAFTSPDSFERMREKTLLLLRNLRAETDNVAIVTFSSRQRRHRSSSISACQTLHFLSPCTPTIIRHLCSVVEGMRPIFSPKSIVREPD